MKRVLKKRNKQKYTALLKEGRNWFPRKEFGKLSLIRQCGDAGNYVFAAERGYGTKNVALVGDAAWS